MTVAERFQRLLDARSETVADAKRRTGLGYATLHGILNGGRDNPRIGTLRKIAKVYGVTAEWLLGRDEGGPVDLVEAFIQGIRYRQGQDSDVPPEALKARLIDAINSQISAAEKIGVPTGRLYELRLRVERDEPI